MSLNIQKYQRKPFTIDAIQVTVDNMQEVAEWCGGEIIIEKQGGRLVQYIKVDVPHAISERQKKAFVQDWVLKTGESIKCYSSRAFPKNFEPAKITDITVREISLNATGYPGQEPLFPAANNA
jgi:hypothetical protein